MIFNQSCRNFLALIFLTFFIQNLQSQSTFIIDSSAVPSGILWKESPLMKRPPETGDTTSFSDGWQAMKSLLNSRLDHDGTGITERRKLVDPSMGLVNTITLFPTALHYQFIDGSQPAYFDSLDGQYFVPSLFMDSVYKSDFTLMVPMSASVMQSREVHFRIPATCGWTNVQGMWEVNFDDGTGWRDLQWDGLMVVQYDNVVTDRIIQFRFTTDGEVYSTSTVLEGSGVEGCDLLPHSPPWITEDGLPWRISALFDGSNISGNAYTLWSEDGIFDLPFVFVEGIDFNSQQWHGQIGDFGWCQFLGADQENYPMLSQSPELISSLRERGYDLILLDFVDGAADIRANAALLKHLLDLCNAYKEGQNQLVVAGASMGGQVVRVALTEMERDGQDHCTGVYISWDSPHQGAHIPMSIQTTIDFLTPFSAEAEAFQNEALSRPASKQMLVNQYLTVNGQSLSPTDFVAFQHYLSELGMPHKCLNWSIANGSGLGTPIETPAWTPLLETSCNASNLFSGDEFRMWLYASPGNPEHALSSNAMYVIADLIYSETYSSLLSFAFTSFNGVYSLSSAAPALDYKPGGYRTSVKELVDVINENADYLDNCNFITADQYTLKHGFISPQSALDFHGNQNIGLLDALIAQPDSTPFDEWYVPPGDNQPHVAMTPQNIQWLLGKLDGLSAAMIAANAYPCSPYHYASTSDHFLFPTTLYGTQVVALNIQNATFCDSAIMIQPPTLKMRLIANCHQSSFVLKDKTVLLVGDDMGLHKCELKLGLGSSIVLYDKSRLYLGLGSKIIVSQGSRIVIEDWSSLVNLGGEIVIEEGGEIIFNGANFSLEHEDARLVIDEGRLSLGIGKTLELQPLIGSTGAAVIKSKTHPAIHFSAGSKLVLQGNNRDDMVLYLDTMANFISQSDFQGSIFIQSGTVRFENNAKWRNQTMTRLEKVRLLSAGAFENNENDIVFENNKILMQDCIVHHLSMSGNQSHLRANQCRWVGNERQRWSKGSLTVNTSDVIGNGWLCQEVGLPFAYRQVTFSGNGNPMGLEVFAFNNAPLVIEECSLSDYETGILQSGGELKVACSVFSQNGIAIEVLGGAFLKLNDGAGGNVFEDNDIHLFINEAIAPGIFNGGNQFGSVGEMSVLGLISMSSPLEILDWSGNEWISNNFILETYPAADPNEVQLGIVQWEPEIPFVACFEGQSDTKTRPIPPIVDVNHDALSTATGFDVYDALGHLLVTDCGVLEYNKWILNAQLVTGIYFVLIHSEVNTQSIKVFIP